MPKRELELVPLRPKGGSTISGTETVNKGAVARRLTGEKASFLQGGGEEKGGAGLQVAEGTTGLLGERHVASEGRITFYAGRRRAGPMGRLQDRKGLPF